MATINKIPKCPPLRFPDFNDDWKETTLGEIAEIKKGSGLSKEDLTESGQPVILYGELYTTYTKEVIDTIYSKTNVNSEKLVVTNGGEVIIPSSGETAWDIATARCVIPSNVILGGDLNIITLKKDNGAFFSYFLNGVRKRAIAEIAQGSSVVHLYGKDIIKLSVSLPSLAEQKKIADFLSLIDERIQSCSETLKERKREKAGLLNQLFSQKLRFPDFNDEWRVTTLGEVAEMNSGGTPSTSNPTYYGGEIPFLSISDISKCGKYIYKTENYITEEGLKNSSARLFPSETIMFAMYASVGKVAIAKVPISCSQAILGISSIEANKVFLYYILIIKSKDYSRLSQVGTQMNLSKALMDKLSISLPTLAEQKKIADFLSLIDERIEVEEQLLKKYEEQKKYLLRKMFV